MAAASPALAVLQTHPRPSTVLLLRTPVAPSRGTDPYHDAFGAFCLPSFPMSALDSGAATPVALPPKTLPEALASATHSTPHLPYHDGSSPHRAPRPEELLLQALQQQQQQQRDGEHEHGLAHQYQRNRANSPHRKYTRQRPTYHSGSCDQGARAAAAASAAENVATTTTTFTLTTHHVSTQALTPSQAESTGLSKVGGSSIHREWCVISLPVIGSRAINEETLESHLAEGDWSGIVATSNRAWDVWKKVTTVCHEKGKRPVTNFQSIPFFLISSRAAANFRSTTLQGLAIEYAPPPTKVYGPPPSASSATKSKKEGDEEQGTDLGDKGSAGQALGEYIVGWYERRREPGSDTGPLTAKPLLILQGDKSLTALPSVLIESKIPCDSIVVYETCADDNIAKNADRVGNLLRDLAWNERSGTNSRRGSGASMGSSSGGTKATLPGGPLTSLRSEPAVSSPKEERAPQHQSEATGAAAAEDTSQTTIEALSNLSRRPDWIVFYSPSGVDFAVEALRSRGWFPPSETTEGSDLFHSSKISYPHYLALGPTTAAHLREKYRIPEASGHATLPVAEKPEPAGVKDAILKAEAEMGSLLL